MALVLGVIFQTTQTDYIFFIILLSALVKGQYSVIVVVRTLSGIFQKYLNWSEESQTVLWIKSVCGVMVILG